MLKTAFKALLIIFLSFSLCHCGFHLRGHINLPGWLHNVYIQNNSGLRTIENALSNQLQAYHVNVSEEPDKSALILNIVQASFQQNIISVSASTTPRQYQIVLLVDFELLKDKNIEIMKKQRVMVVRQVTINNNRILGSNYEEDTIKHEMQREAAYLILNRIKDAKMPLKP